MALLICFISGGHAVLQQQQSSSGHVAKWFVKIDSVCDTMWNGQVLLKYMCQAARILCLAWED